MVALCWPFKNARGLFVTLALVVKSASKSNLSSPSRAALATARTTTYWRRHFHPQLTTDWRLRLHVRHAVQTLCVSPAVNRLLLNEKITLSPPLCLSAAKLNTDNCRVRPMFIVADLPRRGRKKDGPGSTRFLSTNDLATFDGVLSDTGTCAHTHAFLGASPMTRNMSSSPNVTLQGSFSTGVASFPNVELAVAFPFMVANWQVGVARRIMCAHLDLGPPHANRQSAKKHGDFHGVK